MAAYKRNWRKCHADVLAMAESSSDELEILNGASQVEYEFIESEDEGMSDSHIFDNNQESDNCTSDDHEEFSLNQGNEVDKCTEPTFSAKLAAWATKHNCTRSCVNELLTLLRSEGHQLPKDKRTFVQTPVTVVVYEKCGGQYAYFGIKAGILKMLAKNEDFVNLCNRRIELTVNVDGLPLFKSSSMNLWPILCKVGSLQPFLVALYYGKSKPNCVEEFLSDFLTEYSRLLEEGIIFKDIQLNLVTKTYL